MTETLSGVTASTLVELVTQVWSSYLDDAVVAVADGTPIRVDDAVAASVSITGAWNGHVVVRLDRPGAAAAGSTMLGLPEGELGTDDIADTVGEIVNMVGGNVKAILPEPSALGLPHVVFGAELMVLPGATLVADAGLRWHEHTVQVSLWSGSVRSEESS